LRSDWIRTTGGADLMATSPVNDSTLVRFLANAPAAVGFAGWSANTLGTSASVFWGFIIQAVARHRPCSRICGSQGTISGTTASCPSGLSNGYWVDWISGTTEPGSSGSAIFTSDGSSTYIVGVLSCGSSSGTCAGSYDAYGRFSSFYSSIAQFINPAPTVSLGDALDAPV